MTEPSASSSGDIQAVVRAAEVLRLMASGSRSTSVAEASAALGLQRTTTHRYLGTLAQVGLISKTPDGPNRGRYSFGPLAKQIAAAVSADRNGILLAENRMKAIADHTGATTVLCSITEATAIVTHVVYPERMQVTIRIDKGYRVAMDGAQSVLALAFNQEKATLEKIIASAPAEIRGDLLRRVERARVDQFAEQLITDSVRAIAVPLFEDGTICATIGLIATVDVLPEGADSPVALFLRQQGRDINSILASA